MVTIIEQDRKYDGFFKLDTVKFDQKRFDGSTMEGVVREVLIRKPVVFLSLYDPKRGVFLLVEQVRVGAIASDSLTCTVMEPIAGIIDDGESVIDAAVREAFEEANITLLPENLQVVQEGYTSSGTSSEYAYFVTGSFDSSTYIEGFGGVSGEQEDIKTHLINEEEALFMVSDGSINSMSGAFGVLWHIANQHTNL